MMVRVAVEVAPLDALAAKAPCSGLDGSTVNTMGVLVPSPVALMENWIPPAM
jgi:hypothetical protein